MQGRKDAEKQIFNDKMADGGVKGLICDRKSKLCGINYLNCCTPLHNEEQTTKMSNHSVEV